MAYLFEIQSRNKYTSLIEHIKEDQIEVEAHNYTKAYLKDESIKDLKINVYKLEPVKAYNCRAETVVTAESEAQDEQ